ncbi:MAG: hypothetical protein K2R98_24635 [Gemmataceae bacterium]|nr:hypothetical protein [Gemmataceae bacterium]
MFIASCVLVACASPSWCQVPIRPSSDILLDLGPRPKAKAIEIANEQAAQRWKLDKGPRYKSTPAINNNPKVVIQEVVFEGHFTPRSNGSQFAIFSDDGCEVWVDGKRVLSNFAQGQHLPDLKQSFHELVGLQLVAGKEYAIRVRYSNTIFQGPEDIDGCTLFAYAGGGTTPEAHIIADLNRDGKIDSSDDKAELRERGTIVIRNKDGVYSDDTKSEPARRREVRIGITNGKQKKVVVARGSKTKGLEDNIQLFDDRSIKDGKELVFKKNEVELEPKLNDKGTGSITVWLQGGGKPSEKVADHFLKVKIQGQGDNESLSITVLWIDISGRKSGSILRDGTPKNNVYDGLDNVIADRWDPKLGKDIPLGMVRPPKSSESGDAQADGALEINGMILPSDPVLDADNPKPFFGEKLTTGFVDADPAKKDSRASAKFGFVFRRFVTTKAYLNGLPKAIKVVDNQPDCSFRDFQDPDPSFFKKTKQLLIVDQDSPSAGIVPTKEDRWFFVSRRLNFDQYLIFFYNENVPERCSERLKWGASIDIASGDYADKGKDAVPELKNLKAVWVLSRPNLDKSNVNAVIVGSHLPNLDPNMPKPQMESAVNGDGKKEIALGKPTVLIVKGKNLIGQFTLKKGNMEATPFLVTVKPDKGDFSDLAEVKIVFDEKLEPGEGYDLILKNATDQSVIKGFAVKK